MVPAWTLECASPSVIEEAMVVAAVQCTGQRALVMVSVAKRQQDLSLAVLGAQEPDRRSACPVAVSCPVPPRRSLVVASIAGILSTPAPDSKLEVR
jgi:hypothetical protein